MTIEIPHWIVAIVTSWLFAFCIGAGSTAAFFAWFLGRLYR